MKLLLGGPPDLRTTLKDPASSVRAHSFLRRGAKSTFWVIARAHERPADADLHASLRGYNKMCVDVIYFCEMEMGTSEAAL